MGIEIEMKFRLADPVAMRQRIVAAGGVAIDTVLEENTFFDTTDQRLRREDCGLRIRVKRRPAGPTQAILTYKGPRQPGELKIRQEEEIVVSSADAARTILGALDFVPFLTFEKKRETFQLAGAEVVIDELPELGHFLEIEAPDEQTVQAVRQMIGLSDQPAQDTYTAMIVKHLSAKGKPAKELRF
jgi:adenylate cyclase class 2